MKLVKLMTLVALLVPGSLALAATAQQEKMKTCNASAKGMKGEERKKHMSECLSAKAEDATAPATTKASDPKQRMKDCNVQAKGKKGDERKSFMSSCLKN